MLKIKAGIRRVLGYEGLTKQEEWKKGESFKKALKYLLVKLSIKKKRRCFLIGHCKLEC